MSKICCDNFKWRYETSSGMGLNIRVARLVGLDSSPIAFFITDGYTEESTNVKYCKIDYCPFCGTELAKFYKNEKKIINSKIEDFAKII